MKNLPARLRKASAEQGRQAGCLNSKIHY